MSKLLNRAKGFVARNYVYTMMMAFAAVTMAFLAPTFAVVGTLDSVLKSVGTIGGIVVGIIAIVIIVIEAPKIAKGEKAMGGTIAKVLILLLFAGLMLVATNVGTLQQTFGGIANGATSVVTDTACSIVS